LVQTSIEIAVVVVVGAAAVFVVVVVVVVIVTIDTVTGVTVTFPSAFSPAIIASVPPTTDAATSVAVAVAGSDVHAAELRLSFFLRMGFSVPVRSSLRIGREEVVVGKKVFIVIVRLVTRVRVGDGDGVSTRGVGVSTRIRRLPISSAGAMTKTILRVRITS